MTAPSTVILADDDVMVRTVMKNMFKAVFPTVQIIEVNNGDAAIEKLDETVACVIADVMMPERDGIDMCRVIRTSAVCAPYRDVPIVLVSALHAYDALAQRAWHAGTAFFMRKPFAVQDLIRTMTSATRLSPVAPPTVKQLEPTLQQLAAAGPTPVAASVPTLQASGTVLVNEPLKGNPRVIDAGRIAPNGQEIIPLRLRLAAKR